MWLGLPATLPEIVVWDEIDGMARAESRVHAIPITRVGARWITRLGAQSY